jgi:hypothetical protein
MTNLIERLVDIKANFDSLLQFADFYLSDLEQNSLGQQWRVLREGHRSTRVANGRCFYRGVRREWQGTIGRGERERGREGASRRKSERKQKHSTNLLGEASVEEDC